MDLSPETAATAKNVDRTEAIAKAVPGPGARFFEELTLEWMQAWKTRDRSRLEELVADQFCFISRRFKGMAIGKKEWLHMALDSYTLEDYQVRFLAFNLHECSAVIVYRFDVMARPNHSNIPEAFVVTDVWTLTAGGWKAISRQPLQL